MQGTEKISGTQLGLLMFSFVISTLILSVPGVMVAFAKQNAWLSIFPASITGVVSIIVMTTLAKRHPGMTIIQYSSKICGKWFGMVINLYFIYYLFFFISSTVNEHAGFIQTVLLPRTPTIVSIITMLILCAFAVISGIEVIARSNEFLTPLIILSLLPLLILSFWDAEPHLLKPFLAEGIVPVLKGAVVPSAWMSQFFFLGWLLPNLNKPEEAKPIAFKALLSMIVVIVILDLIAIMVFGPITGRLNYSFLRILQYVGITGSLERLEAIAVSIWVMGIFIKVSVLLYMFCISIVQTFSLEEYRVIVFPVTLLSIIGSVWIFKSAAEFVGWITYTYPILAFVTQTMFPLLLLIIDQIKKGMIKSSS